MKNKHTPGPWNVIYDSADNTIYSNVGDCIATVWLGNADNDASLIAAAPDMLAALKEAAFLLDDIAGKVSNLSHYGINTLLVRSIVKFAIDKATGNEKV